MDKSKYKTGRQRAVRTQPRGPRQRDFVSCRERICYYDGEIIDKDEQEDRYGEYTAPQVTPNNHERYEEWAKQRGLGTLANQPMKGTPPNAQSD